MDAYRDVIHPYQVPYGIGGVFQTSEGKSIGRQWAVRHESKYW